MVAKGVGRKFVLEGPGVEYVLIDVVIAVVVVVEKNHPVVYVHQGIKELVTLTNV